MNDKLLNQRFRLFLRGSIYNSMQSLASLIRISQRFTLFVGKQQVNMQIFVNGVFCTVPNVATLKNLLVKQSISSLNLQKNRNTEFWLAALLNLNFLFFISYCHIHYCHISFHLFVYFSIYVTQLQNQRGV